MDQAQAGTIAEVDGSTGAIIASGVTLSLFQGGIDVTDTWLPSPGDTVTVVVNGLDGPSLSLETFRNPDAGDFNGTTDPFLVPPTTSAYPGICTNYPSTDDPNRFNDDFTLSGDALTAHDCGGRAVIEAAKRGNRHFFVVPQDSDVDGIADILETGVCGGNCAPTEDSENPPTGFVSNLLQGDGVAAFDELRGFMISGEPVRFDPRQKDLVVHLVNPQCVSGAPLSSTESLLGGGATTYPTDGVPLFANVETLISDAHVHVIGHSAGSQNLLTDEWVDRYGSFSETDGFSFIDAGGNPVTVAPTDDRQININRVYDVVDVNTGLTVQKGLRMTECVDPGDLDGSGQPILCTTGSEASCLFGFAGYGSANGPDNDLLYTVRIVNEVDRLIALSPSGNVFLNLYDGNGFQASAVDAVKSAYLRFVLAMEVGHAVRNLAAATAETCGFHHCAGTGSNMDAAIVHSVDSNGDHFFSIPSSFIGSDRSLFRVHN